MARSKKQEIDYANLLETVFMKIIDIITRKSVKIHAVILLKDLVDDMMDAYPFVKFIDISEKDPHKYKDTRAVIIGNEINSFPQEKIGVFLHTVIDNFAQEIGKNDTFFLLNELQRSLPREVISQIGNMGVDFELIMLEREIKYFETGK